MKKSILTILTIFIIITDSCSNYKINHSLNINSKTLKTNTIYKTEIYVNDKSHKYFLQIFCKSYGLPHFNCRVIEYKPVNDKYVAEFQFDSTSYYAEFVVSDGKKILNEYKKETYIISINDSDIVVPVYYELLLQSKPAEYLKAFNLCRKNFPKDLGIFPVRWYYEGSNKITNRDSLMSQLNYIENNCGNYDDYFFVLAIGNKLIGNSEKFDYYLQKSSNLTSKLLNIDKTIMIFNDLVGSGINKNINTNSNKKYLNNLILNNNLSYFAARIFSSPFLSEIDSVDLINKLLKIDNFNYYNLLCKKYNILVFKQLKDSLDAINKIEREFDYAYNNQLEIYKAGKNCYFTMLPKKQIYYETKFWKFYNLNDYKNAVDIMHLTNNLLEEGNSGILIENYLRISDIFESKLYNLDSSVYYLIKANDLNSKNSKIKSEITRIKDNYYNGNLNFEQWIDSLKLNYRKKVTFNTGKNSEDKIILLSDNKRVNLNSPGKNLILFFYSVTCSPCKFVFNNISKNSNLLESKNTEIVYIANDQKDQIIELMNKYKLPYQYVENSKEIFDYFHIISVPVIINIDTNGKILNKQDGASENWSLLETLTYF
jgi:peroxiredoxin